MVGGSEEKECALNLKASRSPFRFGSGGGRVSGHKEGAGANKLKLLPSCAVVCVCLSLSGEVIRRQSAQTEKKRQDDGGGYEYSTVPSSSVW